MSIGPSMPLRLEKPEGIDLAQAARYFGARGGADAATQALLEKCAVPLLAAATPRAVWLEADPDSLTAAGILAGEDVAKHLEGCTAALLLAVSVNLSNLYHTWEYSKESMRGKSELVDNNADNQTANGLDLDYMTQWSYGIGETWSLLIPDVKGGATGAIGRDDAQSAPAQYRQIISQQNRYWGDQPFTSGPVYVGAFFMTLFILSFFLLLSLIHI